MNMTLEEAIINCEEITDLYYVTDGDRKRAAEHRKLAEWLKDYKRLLKRESCEDVISRQAAIDAVIEWYGCEPRDIDNFKKILAKQPSAQPERKKGLWNMIQGNIVVCSECGMGAPQVITGCLINMHLEPNRTNFCPECGAKMVESDSKE